jgi:protein-L-isoaspartate(D-aspartate) O-methyltransferase
MVDYRLARSNMVAGQVRTNDVTDHRILAAMLEVPRERFVPEATRPFAYLDEDLLVKRADAEWPARYLIEPMPFAKLLQVAEIGPGDTVLDVGCGTGYSAAVIARLASEVIAVESDPVLARIAAETLDELGVRNAQVIQAPLEQGNPRRPGYDVILLEGSVELVPDALLDQLGEDGRLVAVIGRGQSAKAVLHRRSGGGISRRPSFDCAIAPLPGFSRPPSFVF